MPPKTKARNKALPERQFAYDEDVTYDGHHRRRPQLLEGAQLKQVLDMMRPKVVDQVERYLAKARVPPEVRISGYIAAQRSSHVRASVSALLKGRKWSFVSFAEFLRQLTIIASALFTDLAKSKDDGPVCFVIDSVHKSSFWVLSMALLVLAEKERRVLFKTRKVSIAVDNNGSGGGVRAAFQRLSQSGAGKRTTLVFMDDAVYSGEQLSYFCGYSMRQWGDLYSGDPAPRVVVAVPFVASPALPLFRGYELRTAVKFQSLFHGRSVAASLAADLFIVRPQGLSFSAFQSFHFEFLGIQPTNTLMLFEHKIADALSIPHRWLKAGPCMPSDVRVAYRVKPDLAKQLAEAVTVHPAADDDVLFVFAPHGHRSPPPHREAAQRVLQLMQSPKFRKTYMDRVVLAPPPSSGSQKRPAFYPLLPPEYCEPRYRKFVARLEQAPTALAVGAIPDCIRPPYKRSTFRDHLHDLRW
jgi:hypothetical protein